MCVRLIINVTQVYIPMYTLETLSLSKVCARVWARGLQQPLPILSLISLPLSLKACCAWRWFEVFVIRRDWQTAPKIKLVRALLGCCINNTLLLHLLLARCFFESILKRFHSPHKLKTDAFFPLSQLLPKVEPCFAITCTSASVKKTFRISDFYVSFYPQQTIAIMPLVVYVSGLITTFFSKPMNKFLGRKVSGYVIYHARTASTKWQKTTFSPDVWQGEKCCVITVWLQR